MNMTGKYWDRPWSIVDGCTPCSPGCDHCWSMAMGKRFHKCPDIITTRRDRLNVPVKVKKPTVWAVWNDLFHKNIPAEFIWDAFKVMGGAWHHTYLILTKRVERLKAIHEINPLLRQPGRSPMGKIWDHVWLGVTVCNQQEAYEKIPLLLQTPAAHRWISIEPMLGPINLRWLAAWDGQALKPRSPGVVTDELDGLRLLDAVILGGETGPGARPMHHDWVRTVRDQCASAGVPFFFKQWGEWAPTQIVPGGDLGGDMRHGKTIILHASGNPEGHFTRGDAFMSRLGRTKAGRLLDGREYNDLPWR